MPREITKPLIRFFDLDTGIDLKQRRKLKSFLTVLFKQENTPLASLTYIFCSDDYLRKINKDFLNHDDLTDIITFDLSENKGTIGEIYISVDRVKDNSVNLAVPVNTELHRVIFHGALHLCGFKDKTAKDKLQMTSKEDEYLHSYFSVPRGTS